MQIEYNDGFDIYKGQIDEVIKRKLLETNDRGGELEDIKNIQNNMAIFISFLINLLAEKGFLNKDDIIELLKIYFR